MNPSRRAFLSQTALAGAIASIHEGGAAEVRAAAPEPR